MKPVQSLALFVFLAAPLAGCSVHTHRHATPDRAKAAPPPAVAAHTAPASPATKPAVKPATASPDTRAVLLGNKKVSFTRDRDALHVGPVRGGFKSLRMHVSGSPMEMYDVRVIFGDGTAYSPTTRLRFDQGSWTRNIDLPGDSRQIRRIEFRYRSTGLRTGRANVQAFGVS